MKPNIFFLIAFLSISVSINIQSYVFEKITVITSPIGKAKSGYGGHYAVTRSLVDGLKQSNVVFNYNPSSIDQVGDVIVVLNDIGALAQAIRLKKEGRIKRLLAGPNLAEWPSDNGRILTFPEIDMIVVPSEPTKIAYFEIEPSLKSHICAWFAGINPNDWVPSKFKRAFESKDVIVYWKAKEEGESFCVGVEELLRKYGWNPIRLVYGSYKSPQYKKLLSQARFSVFLSRSESQGIALAEAWAMDVPTLPWNPKKRVKRGRVYSVVSSCPYLTQQTGVDWENLDQLEEVLKEIDQHLLTFTPRKWLLENMTDAISAQKLIDIIRSI